MTHVATIPNTLDFNLGVVEGERFSPARRSGLRFNLFLLLTATIFLRPTDLIPELQGLPIYESIIVLCAVSSLPILANQLRWRTLKAQPWTLCVIGLLPAILLADLSHGNVFAARTNGLDFLKILVYYLLLVGLVDSPERLRKFLVAVALLVTLLAGLALLEYRKVINIPALAPMVEGVGEDAEIDETAVIVRLMATGIFHDPNDFSLVVGASIMIGLYWIFEQRNWLVRILWLGAIATLTYAFVLTQSRGGFVGLSAGTTAILLSRFGWRRSLPILAIVLPCVLVAGGRQTSIDLTDTGDTGHGRIQLWRDSLVLFRTAPVFGIGAGQLAEENELVAHNSYVQAFAELGLVGGTLFVGAWYLCLTVIRKGGDAIAGASFDTLQVLRWRPYVLGMLMTYACGLFSLTRCYAVSTYVILGSGAAYAHIISSHLQVSSSFSGRLCLRVLAVGGLSILGLYVFVHIF